MVFKCNFNWYAEWTGVYLPKDSSHAYVDNSNLINKDIINDLNSCNILPLDFGNRIKTTKINILPKHISLFISTTA